MTPGIICVRGPRRRPPCWPALKPLAELRTGMNPVSLARVRLPRDQSEVCHADTLSGDVAFTTSVGSLIRPGPRMVNTLWESPRPGQGSITAIVAGRSLRVLACGLWKRADFRDEHTPEACMTPTGRSTHSGAFLGNIPPVLD